jgi:hypothetical protein
LASVVSTALIAWLAGVDVGGLLGSVVRAAGNAILAALRFPIELPVWAVALLTIPAIYAARALTLAALSRWSLPARRARLPAVETSIDEAPEPPRYTQDALFGAIWRWPHPASETNLEPICPACEGPLEPYARAGSLSAGLRCKGCNRMRSAGEHPREIRPKVLKAIEENMRSGGWRDAALRVQKLQTAVRGDPTRLAS